MSTATLSAQNDAAASAPKDAPVPENDLTRVLARRGTVRAYKSDPVPDSWVDAIIEYGMRAPTSSNIQAYSVIVVKDAEKKRQLAELAGNQQHIIDCPVYFALCADTNRMARAIEMHGREFPGRTFESGLVSSLDACLVGMTMSLVADSFGLSNVMIGGMRNKPLEVAKVLGLPPRCYVVFGLCVGWAKKPPMAKPRMALSGVVHHDVYDPGARDQAIRDYDKELAKYYRERGTQTPDAAWSQVLAEKFSTDKRKKLREELIQMGFPLE